MTLKEVVVKNPSGFTLDLQTNQLASFETGYQVALTDYSLPIGADVMRETNRLMKCVNAFEKMCPNLKIYLGGWQDNDRIYFDISVHVEGLLDAIVLATTFKQKSIYNWQTNKCQLTNQ